jgi:hypothetical protein
LACTQLALFTRRNGYEHMTGRGCHLGINIDTDRLANAADEIHKAIEKIPPEITIKVFRRGDSVRMDTNEGLNVGVVPRGNKFIWELLRDGTTQKVRGRGGKWQAAWCSGTR